ncbi:hypothetical protein [Vibrio jasicida]|uniref:Uncharacterized protein n=1 Tax=Vibrio jasicida TaxID=766224 RepID=A0ABW7JEZ1_9VIBR
MSHSCVWSMYREKIARVSSLHELIQYRHCYVRGYGLPFKVQQGYLAHHYYSKLPPSKEGSFV